jgi:uncharacterized protein (DUF2141 family)
MKVRYLVVLLAATGCASVDPAGDVTVEIDGVEARGGAVHAALQTRDGFLKPGGLGPVIQAPKAGLLRFTIKDVPPGEYALSALHDTDGDERMTLAPNFIPMEGWAMVGGEKVQGPPAFDDVKVKVGRGGAILKVRMIYFDGKYPTG